MDSSTKRKISKTTKNAKLYPKANRLFQVEVKINDNVYKIKLPNNYRVFATFNMVNLSPYYNDQAQLKDKLSPTRGG